MNDNFLRAKAAARYLGVGKATLWRWAAGGILPAGIRLSPRCTVWRKTDLDAFVAKKAEQQAGA